MKIRFEKYQGAGNDFVLLDNRENIYDKITNSQVKKNLYPSLWYWCRRADVTE